MSSEVVIGTKPKLLGSKVFATRALYTDQTGADNGEWISTQGMDYVHYVANGITTGTVLFRGWNGSTAPAASEHGEAIYGYATDGATLVTQLTADGTVGFPRHLMPAYIKAYPSVVTSIVLDLDMHYTRDS